MIDTGRSAPRDLRERLVYAPASFEDAPTRARAARFAALGGVAALALLGHAPVRAQTAPELANLVSTLTDNGVFRYDPLEFLAAQANDAAWTSVQRSCGVSSQPAISAAVAPTCTGATLQLYDRLRELEDNANELLGDRGETQYSLRLSPLGMADALRWTAPEEFAAQGSMATKFANSQVSVLSSRFVALRMASQGIPLAQSGFAEPNGSSPTLAYDGVARGGGASADPADSFLSRVSVFASAGYGAGTKDPTVLEDAFAFDSTEVSVGADVRLTRRLVVGVLAGHTEKRVDFNSAESVVEGGVRGNGQSGLIYLQLEGDSAYVDVAAGAQHLSLAERRRITYPSNNPDIPSVNETSYGNTGATSWIATLEAGYTWNWHGFAADPYLTLSWVHTRISSFTEYNGNGFDFDAGSQTIPSLEGAVGLKLQYVLTTPLGVLVPYAFGEYRRQFQDSSRVIGSSFASGGTSADEYDLPTDEPARHYYNVGGGGSVVLAHGLQGYIQYSRVLDYTDYTDHVVSGGIRWEF